MNQPTFAYDVRGCYTNNANSIIAGASHFVVAVLNSTTAWWFLTQTCTDLQNGYLQAHNENLAAIPIPVATAEQQHMCGQLAETLIWLHSPKAPADEPQRGLIAAYFEQWLNGLVYELFFADELHTRQLHLFSETAKLAPPSLAELKKAQNLRAFFARAYDIKGRLRAQLDTLPSLDVVRLIEGEEKSALSAS